MIPKAVFDTNILVSGHFWKRPPHRCLLAAEAGLIVQVLSQPNVSELREKLTDKFGVPVEEVDAIIGRLNARAEHVPAQGRSGWVAQDPDDDKFIDAALAGGQPSSFLATATCWTSVPSKESRSSRRDSSSIAWAP